MPTPYDGKVAVWYVYGGMVGERTIDEIAQTLRKYAPAVNQVWVKVTDGTDWMGTFESASDPKPDLAINGPNDISRWVTKLARYNLEFHAWALPKGVKPEAEAALMTQVCQVPGVRSLILDVEGGSGFYRGGRASVRPLMTRLRASIPGTFHIGLSIDPRPNHYDEIFPDEWFPFVNSLHPQAYWGAFSQTPDATLQSTYSTWGKYGRPIIPALQAYDVSRNSMDRARNIAVKTYGATGVSWYVFGAIDASQFPAVNVTIDGSTPPTPPQPPDVIFTGKYGVEIVVTPDSAAYKDGTFNNTPTTFKTFRNNAGWTTKYVPTKSTASQLWARWDPQLPAGGFWEVSAYVPSQHATTNNARFKIHGISGQATEYEAPIHQLPVDDLWVSLGVYNFPGNTPTAGVVFLNDLTGENTAEVAFDAIRWRQVLNVPTPPPYLADGFDSPLGAAADRKLTALWPPIWYTSNGFENFYYLGPGNTNPALHTGDDMILYDPRTGTRRDAAHQPIYAIASGIVRSVAKQTGSWGNVIVIQHDPYIGTGKTLFSRYGHVESMVVKVGDRVSRGQHIANVGNAFGRFVYHLHFDISPTRVLLTRPWDWPGLDKKRLETDYIDPFQLIRSSRPAKP
jgi:murein DD-endopeptidase MepM/ murein hydrolase activator NlpD